MNSEQYHKRLGEFLTSLVDMTDGTADIDKNSIMRPGVRLRQEAIIMWSQFKIILDSHKALQELMALHDDAGHVSGNDLERALSKCRAALNAFKTPKTNNPKE